MVHDALGGRIIDVLLPTKYTDEMLLLIDQLGQYHLVVAEYVAFVES